MEGTAWVFMGQGNTSLNSIFKATQIFLSVSMVRFVLPVSIRDKLAFSKSQSMANWF
jgi:hypothetical protein